jgi:hypothetical protein
MEWAQGIQQSNTKLTQTLVKKPQGMGYMGHRIEMQRK